MAGNEGTTPGVRMDVEEMEQVTPTESNRKISANQESAPSQLDSAYSSYESASLSRSRESCSGSKSLHSGSSHSSVLGDHQAEFRRHGKYVKKIKDVKEKPPEKNIVKKEVKEEVKEDVNENAKAKEQIKIIIVAPPKEEKRPEGDKSSATEAKETLNYNSHSPDVDPGFYDQPTLVYTQALNYIRKIKERSAEQGLPFASPDLVQLPRDTQQVATFLKSLKSLRGFTAAISIQDGTVLQVPPQTHPLVY